MGAPATSEQSHLGTHTIDEPDALFGLISHLIKESTEDLQCPADLVNLLNKKLRHRFVSKGLDFEVASGA